MDTAISEEQLKEILDRIVREVTEASAGIYLSQTDSKPGADVCTVHINFRRGFHSSLSLRADTAMLIRLAQSMLNTEQVTRQDVEEAAKEYFNMLCGRIAAALRKETGIAARFSVPAFHWGSYGPEDHREQFAINYSSRRNEAAQLVHHVPIPQEEPDAGPAQQHQIIQKEGTKTMAKRVMVVDDSRVQEVQIRALLQGTDYEVVQYCRSGEEALAVYDQVKPDLVTMDIIMPGMDGLETAQAILEEYPDARIIMVSSLAYDDTFDEAKAIGAKAFLDKPINQEKLLRALMRAELD